MNQEIELKIIEMSEVESKEISWLWYPFIPYGKLTIIQGDPGDGKTKCIFYGHQMCIKNGRKGLEIGRKWHVWTKCPDVMRGGQGKKFTFGQNVQTRNGKNMV